MSPKGCKYQATPWIALFGIVVDFYARHSAQVAESLDTEIDRIVSLRLRFVEFVIEASQVWDNVTSPKSRQKIGMAIEFMVLNKDVLSIHPELSNGMCNSTKCVAILTSLSVSAKLARIPEQLQEFNSEVDHTLFGADHLRAKLTHFEMAMGTYEQSLHPAFGEAATLLRHSKTSLSI